MKLNDTGWYLTRNGLKCQRDTSITHLEGRHHAAVGGVVEMAVDKVHKECQRALALVVQLAKQLQVHRLGRMEDQARGQTKGNEFNNRYTGIRVN